MSQFAEVAWSHKIALRCANYFVGASAGAWWKHSRQTWRSRNYHLKEALGETCFIFFIPVEKGISSRGLISHSTSDHCKIDCWCNAVVNFGLSVVDVFTQTTLTRCFPCQHGSIQPSIQKICHSWTSCTIYFSLNHVWEFKAAGYLTWFCCVFLFLDSDGKGSFTFQENHRMLYLRPVDLPQPQTKRSSWAAERCSPTSRFQIQCQPPRKNEDRPTHPVTSYSNVSGHAMYQPWNPPTRPRRWITRCSTYRNKSTIKACRARLSHDRASSMSPRSIRMDLGKKFVNVLMFMNKMFWSFKWWMPCILLKPWIWPNPPWKYSTSQGPSQEFLNETCFDGCLPDIVQGARATLARPIKCVLPRMEGSEIQNGN